MKLKELAAKPQLTEIEINDEAIVEKYGEALIFYIYDRLPAETYTKLATLTQGDVSSMYDMVRDLILDEDGKPVVTDGYVLPVDVMNAAITKVTDSLGK